MKAEGEGARVELFLIGECSTVDSAPVWETLARPARRLPRGARIKFGNDGRLQAEVIDELPEGRRLIRFHCAEDFHALLQEYGSTPLPPYIKRESTTSSAEDSERYQTVYARRRGAIAAPTAGLHFTPHVLEQIKARGASIVELTLHVGYGTFAPVREVNNLQEHRVAPEQCEIEGGAAERINEARAQGHRIIAVGTTTTRALESSVDEKGRVMSGARAAGITITPGYRFRVIDGLLTNFHLPQSSLLLLVSAFAGRELTLAAYRHAVAAQYRFYSYGDCMLII
jgi:S-adenosylmethionine:tRNA ribosyltransferase-isomerase